MFFGIPPTCKSQKTSSWHFASFASIWQVFGKYGEYLFSQAKWWPTLKEKWSNSQLYLKIWSDLCLKFRLKSFYKLRSLDCWDQLFENENVKTRQTQSTLAKGFIEFLENWQHTQKCYFMILAKITIFANPLFVKYDACLAKFVLVLREFCEWHDYSLKILDSRALLKNVLLT